MFLSELLKVKDVINELIGDNEITKNQMESLKILDKAIQKAVTPSVEMGWIKTADCLPTLFGKISNPLLVWNERFNLPELCYLDQDSDENYDWVVINGKRPLDFYKYWMLITSPEEE